MMATAIGRVSAAAREAELRLGDAARTTAFLQGRLRFEARADDVFISSYPRSGTTLVQQIVDVLLHDGESGTEHLSERSPWFERNLALGRSSVADFARLPSPRAFKSHLPRAWLPSGARYVYVVRDGRDVAVSYYHLYRSHLDFSGAFEQFFELFLHGELQYGSWFKHVDDWRRHARSPDVCFVEYEQLTRDLTAGMTRLSTFLGTGHTPERIAQLSELCSFAYMKSHEDRFDHATEERALRGLSTGSFVRTGRVGEHRAIFCAEQLRRFDEQRRSPRRLRLELDLPAFLH